MNPSVIWCSLSSRFQGGEIHPAPCFLPWPQREGLSLLVQSGASPASGSEAFIDKLFFLSRTCF